MNIGDVVWLKSGGPAMTVATVGDDCVDVVWLHEGKMQYASFPIAAADVVEEADKDGGYNKHGGAYLAGHRDGLAGAIKVVDRMWNARAGTLAAEVIREVLNGLES